MRRCTRHVHEADEQTAVHFVMDLKSTVEEDCETTEENMEVETCEEVETELWNEEIALNYKQYLQCGSYPTSLPKEKRRNLRKRVNDFEVKDGKLFYKKSGSPRLALYKREDWLRVFQVSFIA